MLSSRVQGSICPRALLVGAAALLVGEFTLTIREVFGSNSAFLSSEAAHFGGVLLLQVRCDLM